MKNSKSSVGKGAGRSRLSACFDVFSKIAERKGSGFTLIEMVITVGIIGLFSAMVLANYNAGKKDFILQSAAYQLAQEIRKAEEMAMSLREHPTTGQIPQGGYGIFIPDVCAGPAKCYEVYLYANTGGDMERRNDGEDIETIYKEISQIYIGGLKEIKIINVTLNWVNHDQAHINFRPPDPATTIKKATGTVKYDLVVITLALKSDESRTRTVYVNKAGLIEVR